MQILNLLDLNDDIQNYILNYLPINDIFIYFSLNSHTNSTKYKIQTRIPKLNTGNSIQLEKLVNRNIRIQVCNVNFLYNTDTFRFVLKLLAFSNMESIVIKSLPPTNKMINLFDINGIKLQKILINTPFDFSGIETILSNCSELLILHFIQFDRFSNLYLESSQFVNMMNIQFEKYKLYEIQTQLSTLNIDIDSHKNELVQLNMLENTLEFISCMTNMFKSIKLINLKIYLNKYHDINLFDVFNSTNFSPNIYDLHVDYDGFDCTHKFIIELSIR